MVKVDFKLVQIMRSLANRYSELANLRNRYVYAVTSGMLTKGSKLLKSKGLKSFLFTDFGLLNIPAIFYDQQARFSANDYVEKKRLPYLRHWFDILFLSL